MKMIHITFISACLVVLFSILDYFIQNLVFEGLALISMFVLIFSVTCLLMVDFDGIGVVWQ